MDAKRIVIRLLGVLILLSSTSFGATKCVDKSGAGGCYTTIQAGIDSAGVGDTITVAPGIYNESINVTKQVFLRGNGHEITAISYSDPTPKPAVKFTSASTGAKVSEFRITSITGNGIDIDRANVLISNCFICWCGGSGIYIHQTSPSIINNVIAENTSSGISVTTSNWISPRLYNNIIFKNNGCGVSDWDWVSYQLLNNCYFGNKSGNLCGMGPGTGDIQQNPNFVDYPADLHLGLGSPCIDSGRQGFDYYDCDGTRNDMGIYGGPDAYCGPGPVVTDLQVVPSTVVKGETFDIQASGSTR